MASLTISSISSRISSGWSVSAVVSIIVSLIGSRLAGSESCWIVMGILVDGGSVPRNFSTIGLDTTKLTAATTPKITAKRHRHRARPASLRLLIGGFTIFSLMNFLSLGESAMGNSFN